MNRKLIKSITSKILWVALFASVIACEKDNLVETQDNGISEIELQQIEPEIKTQQLNIDDFPHKMQVKSYLQQINQNTASIILGYVSNSNTDDDFNPLTGLNILQNQAEYTTYQSGHTYTFATYRANDNGLIENIVLESQPDGSYNEYLMQYQLSDTEYQNLQEHNPYGFNLLDRTTLIPLENGSFNALVTNSVNCEKEAYTYSSTMIIGFCTCPEHQASHQDGTCICEFAPRATVDYIGLKTKCSGGGGTTTVIGDNPGDGTDPGDFSSGGTTDINDPNSGTNNENGNTDNSGTDDAVNEIGGVTKPFEVLDVDTILADCLGHNTPSYYQAQSLSLDNKNAVANYINTNGCTDENSIYIEEVLEVLDDEGEVDIEERIFKDESFTDSEAECVHDKLLEDTQNNFYKQMINSFSNNDEVLTFKIGTTAVGEWGITTGHEANNNINPIGLTTSLDFYTIKISNQIESASNIAQMVTLCHELIHAYMLDSLDDLGIITYFPNGDPKFNSTQCTIDANVNINSLSEKDKWLALICAYNANNAGSGQWVHALFNTANFDVNSYRSKLENLLLNNHDWVNENPILKLLLEDQFGDEWKEKASEFMSWKGLEKTDEFIVWAENNNINIGIDENGATIYPSHKLIVDSIKNLGKKDCSQQN
ncbi:hypothetical protein [Winogradskyella sp. PC D3.3]